VRPAIPRDIERFAFGENWRRFLAVLDDARIRHAELSIAEMLGPSSIVGRSFLDIGSGSGLFSLAAFRLGASRVHSIDVDPSSVACTQEVKRRFAPTADHWTIGLMSVLDHTQLEELGEFDVVYSWGVLHHTGDMYRALSNAALAVAPGGRLFISIYNDQGRRSRRWRSVKRIYQRLPQAVRPVYVALVMVPHELRNAVTSTVRLRPQRYLRSWTAYKHNRGMSRWHDLVDWVGGYPFEVATPEAIFDYYHERGFVLKRLVTKRAGSGCNEFVFERPLA
jgi:2-polyprenyl-3-methyl-5-hydroxy-6-metoxy-1,4-benzoquinol methylase